MKNNTANSFKGPYWLCNIEYTMRGVKNCKGEKPRAAELGLEQETKAHVMPGRRKFPFVMVMYANLGGGGRPKQSLASNACKLGPGRPKQKLQSGRQCMQTYSKNEITPARQCMQSDRNKQNNC